MSVRALALAALLVTSADAVADDFRLETLIFVGEAEEYDSRTVSLYHQGVYYDLQGIDKPATVYSPAVANRPGRFVLLDPLRKVKTEFTTDRVDAYIAKLTRWAMAHNDRTLRFAAAPEFKTQFDDATNRLTLASDELTYTVDTQTLESPERVRVLIEFLDGFAKLNCQLSTGLPPGPRMAVNRELLSRQLAPKGVQLASDDVEKPDLRSEHKLAWLLSKDDHDAIAVINEQLVKFDEVSNAEYQSGLAEVP
jgi:hypothetical protein